MFDETKTAVRKAFEIGKTLFTMGPKRYDELLKLTSRIRPPSIEEIELYVEGRGLTLEEAYITILKERYSATATQNGFTKQQGIAMLEYAALEAELNG